MAGVTIKLPHKWAGVRQVRERMLAQHRCPSTFDRARPLAGHADAEARRSVLTALPCATLVTVPTSLRQGWRTQVRERMLAQGLFGDVFTYATLVRLTS